MVIQCVPKSDAFEIFPITWANILPNKMQVYKYKAMYSKRCEVSQKIFRSITIYAKIKHFKSWTI